MSATLYNSARRATVGSRHHASTGDGPTLGLLINHDDAQREYAYESVAGTFGADETILDTASRLDWTVGTIKSDWRRVFAAAKARKP